MRCLCNVGLPEPNDASDASNAGISPLSHAGYPPFAPTLSRVKLPPSSSLALTLPVPSLRFQLLISRPSHDVTSSRPPVEPQALEVIQRGSSNRRKADTTLNSMSSRSHSVFTVTLLGTSGERLSKLSFVDLAGSERATRCCIALPPRCPQNMSEHSTPPITLPPNTMSPPRPSVPHRHTHTHSVHHMPSPTLLLTPLPVRAAEQRTRGHA